MLQVAMLTTDTVLPPEFVTYSVRVFGFCTANWGELPTGVTGRRAGEAGSIDAAALADIPPLAAPARLLVLLLAHPQSSVRAITSKAAEREIMLRPGPIIGRTPHTARWVMPTVLIGMTAEVMGGMVSLRMDSCRRSPLCCLDAHNPDG
jgi:hypothetical protein